MRCGSRKMWHSGLKGIWNLPSLIRPLAAPKACLKHVDTPKRRAFFRQAIPIFPAIYPVFLRKIVFVWRKNSSPLCIFPFFKWCLATLLQAVPQLHQTELCIAAAHVPDQFQLRFRMLARMAVRTPGLSGQGRHTSIPAGTPEVDIRPALVVLPTGTADAIFLRILH